MKAVVALFLAAVCLAQATQVPHQTASKEYLIKQKNIYELFWHIDQPTVYHPELYQKARSYSIEDNISSYEDQAIVTEFLQRWKHGMLPRGEVFSTMYPLHQEEMICMFRVLYTAKDFNTFYNTAVWARFHVNEGIYVYALFNAVLHRQDTREFRVPPLYEIVPHLFFNDDVLYKAYHIAMGNTGIVGVKKTTTGAEGYYIPTNYSGWYVMRDNVPEHQKLSYYIEDIGLNSYYFTTYHDFPWWMNSAEYHMPQNIRGEIFMFNHKQLLTRYYLERLSNNMGEVDYVDVTKPIRTGYYPTMHHPKGVPFVQRPVDAEIPLENYHYVQLLQDYHNHIAMSIDMGFLIDKHGKHVNIYNNMEGLNLLGNVIDGNADSINNNLYGSVNYLYRKILGFVPEPIDKYHVVPSSLHFISSSMRDPVFYGMVKNIVNYWTKYKEHLPSYTHKELAFPGVKIESVNVDKLMTFFDHHDSLINNAVSVHSQEQAQSMLIKARQYRLNHKPFTYHITVNSDKNTKAVVRTFFAPKYDNHGHELDISENYMNFYEVDQWMVDLKTGTNKIERNSHESIYVVPDEIPSDVLYKKMVKAIEGEETFTYPGQKYGFPDRLILPKGRKEGFPLKLFVCVTTLDETKSHQVQSPVWGPAMLDGRPMGYPLDRPVHSFNFTMPNFYMKDVLVYHRQAEELNLTI